MTEKERERLDEERRAWMRRTGYVPQGASWGPQVKRSPSTGPDTPTDEQEAI